MEGTRWVAILDWISLNPFAAGAVIFLIAFCDALLLVGIAVPAAPLLFAIGTLIGLGHLDGPYALLCAAAGAFCGDGLSYLLGRRYGDRLRTLWPFSRYPQWLDRSERLFRRHGMKSLLIGRFVGAIRPFLPAIAGTIRMPGARYVIATGVAATAWAIGFIGPGWLFGLSLDLVAAVAGKLATLLALLLALVAGIWAVVYYVWRWLAPRANGLLLDLLRWSHRHPVIGRYSEALIDPNRRESPSLLLLGSGLILAGWGFFHLLVSVGGGSAPSTLDLRVHHAMFALRHPLADPVMGFLASLGDLPVLLPAVGLIFVWLWWRRRRIAAWHWLAAPAFALLLSNALGWLIDLPRPPAATAVAGFGFPSQSTTMALSVFGFFAVLVARELPGRNRVWPYVVAGLLTALVGFSRLYLGAHWLSDVLAGMALGLAWITALGLAYRRRVARSFWVKPIAAVFFGAILLAATWHGSRHAAALVEAFDQPLPRSVVGEPDWLAGNPALNLASRRNELRGRDAWMLNVQVAGDLDALSHHLAANGWSVVPRSGWRGLLAMLDDGATDDTLPILPATHQGHAEGLLMSKPGISPSERVVLRLWPTPYAIGHAKTPLWLGTVHTLRFTAQWDDNVRFWSAQPALEAAEQQLRADTPTWQRACAAALCLRSPGTNPP